MSTPASPIPRNYLCKEGGRWLPVKLYDLCTLLHNIQEGAKHPDVGFEDATKTIEDVVARLNKKILLPPDLIESALWSCNLMNEEKAFWDFKGRDLDTFIKQVVVEGKFNKLYNTIERKPR
jgi:hypothetical protein